MARSEVQAGVAAGDVLTDLAVQFPNVEYARLLSIVRTEQERKQRLERIADTNWGRIQRMPELLGCSPGATTVRVRATIRGVEEGTGVERKFNTTVTARMGDRVTAMLTNVARGIAEAAAQAGYVIDLPRVIGRRTLGALTIDYIDCV